MAWIRRIFIRCTREFCRISYSFGSPGKQGSAMEGDRPETSTKQQQDSVGAKVAASSHQPRIMFFLVLLGIALRAWAYFRYTSLYLDEILLSRNILQLPLGHLLTKPLALDQVSPRGFLLFERLAVNIFGPNEMAL